MAMPTVSGATTRPGSGRWWSLTTAGSVTALIGAACLLALFAQALVREGAVSLATVGLAALVITLLIALDQAVELHFGEQPARRLALAAVAAHLLLVETLTLLDGLTYTAIMYLTLPFPACFRLGRRAGLALSFALLGWFTLKFALLKPNGFADPAAVNTYLLFVVALTLITTMAQVVQRERASRQRAEQLLRELDRSHQQLAAAHAQVVQSSAQVAALATVAERNRLARDIHDSLGHYLTVVGVQLEKALVIADEDPAALRSALGHAKRLTDQALRDVRESVSTLREDTTPFLLGPALQQLADNLHGLAFAVHLTLDGDEERYSRQQRLVLYRAAQEGLTNVQRHAGAQTVWLQVDLGERAATLSLEDDGAGVSGEVWARAGSGLHGVRERLEPVSGRLTVQPRESRGTRLEVTVPRSTAGGGGR